MTFHDMTNIMVFSNPFRFAAVLHARCHGPL